MLDWLGVEGNNVPLQCDGSSLLPFLEGNEDAAVGWREEAHWEYDFRDVTSSEPVAAVEQRLGLTMHQCGLMASRSKKWKYVHFTNLPPLLFDTEADPHELRNLADEPALLPVLLDCANRMLSFRMMYADRALTGRRLVRDKAGLVNIVERNDKVWAGQDNLPRHSRL
eukprot:SAG22_NODE_3211_length_1855_cov_1.268223_3_plen_168_part_00